MTKSMNSTRGALIRGDSKFAQRELAEREEDDEEEDEDYSRKTKGSSLGSLGGHLKRNILSANAQELLNPGVGQDLLLQADSESVSSMNDSIYFGGGASVTGGYSNKHRKGRGKGKRVKSKAAPTPGSSAEVPIDVSVPIDLDDTCMDDLEDFDDLYEREFAIENCQRTHKRENSRATDQAQTSAYNVLDLGKKREQSTASGKAQMSPSGAVVTTDVSFGDDEDSCKRKGCCCCLRGAPGWFRCILFVCVTITLVAAAYIAVDLLKPWIENVIGSNSARQDVSPQTPVATPSSAPVLQSAGETTSTTNPAITTPTNAPIATEILPKDEIEVIDSKESPSQMPVSKAATTALSVGPTSSPVATATSPPKVPTLGPSDIPSSSPTFSPSSGPSVNPTHSPTINEEHMYVYLTSGRYEDEDVLMERLPTLPNSHESDFLLHLGNWNDADNGCEEDSYVDVAELYRHSAPPVYFVMGENEFTGCDNSKQAKTNWLTHLLGYQSLYWDPEPWEIFNQGDSSLEYEGYSENYMFANEKIAFLSINLVDGDVSDEQELTARLEANYVWISAALAFYAKQAKTIFIASQSGPPGNSAEIQAFYTKLFLLLESDYNKIDIVFIHRTDDRWEYVEKYNNVKNLSILSVEDSSWPPARLTIDFTQGRLIDVDTEWNIE